MRQTFRDYATHRAKAASSEEQVAVTVFEALYLRRTPHIGDVVVNTGLFAGTQGSVTDVFDTGQRAPLLQERSRAMISKRQDHEPPHEKPRSPPTVADSAPVGELAPSVFEDGQPIWAGIENHEDFTTAEGWKVLWKDVGFLGELQVGDRILGVDYDDPTFQCLVEVAKVDQVDYDLLYTVRHLADVEPDVFAQESTGD